MMRKLNLAGAVGERVDRTVSLQVPELSRSYVKKLIDDGLITVEGRAVKPGYILKDNQNVEVSIPEPETLSVEAEDIPLGILYEDGDFLIINKPQGMVVHPAAGNHSGTLVNALMKHCGGSLSQINGIIRPGIVHRLDKDTSGLLMVAKNNEAHNNLAAQIKEHTIVKRYIAIVHSGMKNDSGTIDKPIGRHHADRKKMCVTDKNSRSAVTHYKVLERFGRYTYVECVIETGRTHQIRVHLSSIGSPILGDKLYGVKKEKFALDGQLLHAVGLELTHPRSGEKMVFETPVPERFKKVLNFLKNI